MISYYELETMLGEFIKSKGFILHSSIFTATGKNEAYRYSLVISKNNALEKQGMKAETDLYCGDCGSKIYSRGEEMRRQSIFTGDEERCSNCDATLRRRSPGGQSDTWNFVIHDGLGETKNE